MRTIDRSSAFKRDFKKHGDIDAELIKVLYLLLNDETLPEKYRDHTLVGEWSGYHECHLKPDLLLIYKKSTENTRVYRMSITISGRIDKTN